MLVELPDAIRQGYETGRGSFRLRARWTTEAMGHGLYQIVVTEVPFQVQKSRLVEKIAGLLEEKKLPLLADVRDELAEDVRLVLEPKTRNVDAEMLMEQLFRSTDLEVRVPLNLNVLDPLGVPRVMNLKETLQAFLDHRRVVLQRRSRHRLTAVARRMEILHGQIIVYLNLDEVIRIIREGDDPKAEMMARWELTEVQAEAILNMRLRALRRLEEIEIRKELDRLSAEETKLTALLASERRQWRAIANEVKTTGAEFGGDTPLGRRRTEIGAAPAPIEIPVAALIEREPVTVLCSAKGWIRTVKGHNVPAAEQKYKEGDAPRFAVNAETTDRLIVFGSNGRFYTIGVDRLPGGRGHGEPLRLMIDLPNEHDIVAMFPYRLGMELLVAANDGRGFVVDGAEAVAQTRAGKQVLTPADGAVAQVCVQAETGDAVAFVGDNRKMLIVKLDDIPLMTRGRGVILQRYKSGGLADCKVFRLADGLSWRQGENRVRTETNLAPWLGSRGSAGRLVPGGFPRSNRFGDLDLWSFGTSDGSRAFFSRSRWPDWPRGPVQRTPSHLFALCGLSPPCESAYGINTPSALDGWLACARRLRGSCWTPRLPVAPSSGHDYGLARLLQSLHLSLAGKLRRGPFRVSGGREIIAEEAYDMKMAKLRLFCPRGDVDLVLSHPRVRAAAPGRRRAPMASSGPVQAHHLFLL